MDTPNSIDVLPQSNMWAQAMQAAVSRGLSYCEEFETIAKRFEAWWAHDLIDRPILIAKANTNPARPITRRLELLKMPEEWLKEKTTDMEQVHRVGDALPNIRVDFGPVLLGSLLGGERKVGADTSWTHAFINDDWTNAPNWQIDNDNADWKLLQKLTQLVAEEAAGKYLLCTPDLGGSGDVLLNLRGAQDLCMDVVVMPDRVKEALDTMFSAWEQAFSMLYQTATDTGAGLIHWLEIWSNQTYMVPACDFNALIGPDHFRDIFAPDIQNQSAAAGRGVFHLDGPDAANHIDTLLELDELQAIQFTPGTGTPSALAWVDMFKKIQKAGRSVIIITPPDELIELCETLDPAGLAIILDGGLSPAELDDLYAAFCKKF